MQLRIKHFFFTLRVVYEWPTCAATTPEMAGRPESGDTLSSNEANLSSLPSSSRLGDAFAVASSPLLQPHVDIQPLLLMFWVV